MRQKITIKVLRVQRFPSKTPESYKDLEVLSVVDANGKRFELSRFRHDKEITCKKNHFYMGDTKSSNNPQNHPNDIFENVIAVMDFDGVETPFDGEEIDPQLERQASILCQSDLHTCAPIVAAIVAARGVDITTEEKSMIALYCHHSRLAGKAREQLTAEYLRELTDKEMGNHE